MDMSHSTYRERALPKLPCHVGEPDLWFAEDPADLERAKDLCAGCPIRRQCLDAALEREEPWGVWGGQIFERGEIVARKRPRGRPRKNAVAA
jgi:WhiB family redox-sensing transcriptional regulator